MARHAPRSARRLVTPARLAAFVAALLLASPAAALVDGTPPTLWKKHTVQGNAVFIGNTLMTSLGGGPVNDTMLDPADTVATLSGIPAGAQLVGAYVFWSGSLNTTDSADRFVDVQLPDGSIQPAVAADLCRTLGRTQTGVAGAYYCRADVTNLLSQHLARLPDGTRTLNGTYNLMNVYAAVGVPTSPGSGSCWGDDPCQAAFGGWAMALVWSSPELETTREVLVYDGFMRMDEICNGDASGRCTDPSSGVAPPFTLGGFSASSRNAELSFFALEGDRQLGSPPEPAQNADFMRFAGVELQNSALGVFPRNLFNSVIFNRQGGTPFNGVDIKTLPVQLPPLTGSPPLVTSVQVQPGSGDGVPDVGPYWPSMESNGELFYLGSMVLSVETVAPRFRDSTKKVDRTTAAPGDTLTYTIRVVNSGSWAATTVLTDVLPDGLEYVPNSTRRDGALLADVGNRSALASGLGLGVLVPVGRPSVELSFQARVRANHPGGTICNTAEIAAEYQPPGSGLVRLPVTPVTTSPCTTVVLPNVLQPKKTVTVEGNPSTRQARPGDRLRYRVRLENRGGIAASGLTLTDDLPPFLKNLEVVSIPSGAIDESTPTGGANGTGRLLLRNITIPAGFAFDVIFDAEVMSGAEFFLAGGTDGATLPNTAVLSGPSVAPSLARSDDPFTPTPNDPTTLTIRLGVDLSASQKTVTGDSNGFVMPGQTVTYTVRLTNRGSQAAQASIDDDLPAYLGSCEVVSGPITCAPGGVNGSGRVVGSNIPVAAGQSVDVSFRVRVLPTAPDGARLTNVAVVGSNESTATHRISAPTLTVRSEVRLASTKRVTDLNGGGIEPGDELQYAISVRNAGNQASSAVTITDALDPNLTFVSASHGGGFAGGRITWSSASTPALASIAPNAEVTVTFRARINAGVPNGTTIPNQAQVSSAESSTLSDDPGTPAHNDPTIVRVVAAPSFVDSTKRVVDLNGGDVEPGDLLEWRIEVRNTGRANATNVSVSDAIDPSLTVETIGNGGTLSGSTITWTIPRLDAGAGAHTLTFTTRVRTPLANGTVISNQALIRSDDAPSAVPTDDPTTPALDDPTSVVVRSKSHLSASTKTVVDNDGGEALPGDSLTWTIRVLATGNAPVRDVVVIDPIAPCLVNVVPGNGGTFDGSRVRWDATGTPTLAEVHPGIPVDLTFTAQIRPGTPDGTRCANQAGLTSPDVEATITDDPRTPEPSDPTVVVVVSRPVLSASTKTATLLEDANGDGAFSPGDRIRYSIAAKNTGNETATGVVLTDELSPLLTDLSLSAGGTLVGRTATWNLGNIAAGSETVVTVDATIVKPLDDGTVLENQGRLRATNLPEPALTDDPSTLEPNDPTRIVLRSVPVLAATKTVLDVNGGRVEPGDLVRYTVTLRNEGTSLARDVRIEDVLDANLDFVSSTQGSYDSATRTLLVTTAELDLTTELRFSFDARIKAALDNGTVIDNQTRTTSREVVEPQLSDDPTTAAPNDPTRIVVISAADLTSSTKTFVDRNGGDARPGDLLDYTITVRNTGNAPARDLVVRDVLDSRLSIQQPILDGGTLGPNGELLWTRFEPLGVGESATFRFTARIALPLPDGIEIPNQAQLDIQGLATPFVTDDPSTPELGDPTIVRVTAAPDVALTKTVTDVNGGSVRPGDELRYELTVRNTGDALATNVVVTDVLDTNLDFVSTNAEGTWNAATRTVTWTLGDVGITPADRVVTLTARVKRPLEDGTIIPNQAQVRFDELGTPVLSDDPTTPAPLDPTRVTVVAKPDLSATQKTVIDLNGGDFAPEDEVEYAIVVRNTGDDTATGVVVRDVIDAALVDVVPTDGGTFDAATRTITWNLPSLALSPDGDRTLRFRARIAPMLPNGTRVSNQAFVSSAQTPTAVPSDDPATPEEDDPTTLTVVSAPQLQTSTKIVIDEDGGLVRPGDTLLYTLVVRNSGNTLATDVVVEDPIDPVLTDVTPLDGGLFDGAKIRWDRTTTPTLASLRPHQDEVTLTFRARIGASAVNGEPIANQATVSSAEGVRAVTDDPGTPQLGDPTLITPLFPDLARTTKTVLDENGGDVEPGDFLVFTIRVTNGGALPATSIVVEDPIDTMNLVDVQPLAGGVFSGSRVTWNASTTPGLARLGPGESVDLAVRARVRPLTANGTRIENQATVTLAELIEPVLTDADLTTPEREPTSVTVVARPRFEASTLSVTDPNGDEVRPGDRLDYRLVVRNTGNTLATNTTVTIALPRELVNVQLDGPGTLTGTSITLDASSIPALASLAPGVDVELAFHASVRRPMPNDTVISLQGRISADELDEPAVTDDPATPVVGDPTSVRVFSAPRFIKSEKTITDLNGGVLEPGDEVLYEIVVINDGTETGFGTRLTDVVPAGLTYVPGSLTLNGERVDDEGGFPLAHGLTVRSQRPGTAPGEVLVDDGVLPDDETALVQFRATVDRTTLAGTVISNQGVLTSTATRAQRTDDPTTPQQGDATIAVVGSGASLTGVRLDWKLIEDFGEPGSVNPGDLIEVRVEVPNNGQQPLACAIAETPFDARLVPEGALELDGRSLTPETDGDAGEWLSSGAGSTATVRLGVLAPKTLSTVRMRVRAAADASGSVTIQARVFCEGSLEERSDSDPSLPGAQPAVVPIRIAGGESKAELGRSLKTVEDLNGGAVLPGDVLRYRITIVNDGDRSATDVTLTDVFPAGLTYVAESVEGDGGLRVDGQALAGVSTVSATLEELAAGARATVSFLARVDDGVALGRTLSNVAQVSARGVERFSLPPSNVTVGSLAGTAALLGKVWEDLDESGTFDPAKDDAYAGFLVQLVRAGTDPDQPASVAKSVFADLRGDFSLLGVPAGTWELVFRSPDGAEYLRREVLSLEAGESRIVDGQLTPTGIVYRSANLTGVGGARVFVHYDDSFVGQLPPDCDEDRTSIVVVTDPEHGRELPRRVGAGCLASGQQGQKTAPNGAYRLDFAPQTSPVTYRLHVEPASQQLAFPSTQRPPETGIAPRGAAGQRRRPTKERSENRSYTRLTFAATGDDVVQNHLALDAMEDAIRIVKQASRGTIRIGEFVTYTVTVTNGSGRDLLVSRGDGLSVLDMLPPDMRYVRGSARALRRDLTGDRCASIDGERDGVDCAQGAIEPQGVTEGHGRIARFGLWDLKSGETLVLRYTLTPTGNAKPGDHDNVAHAQVDGVRVSRDAMATVRLMSDPLFDESVVVGKVFCDDDGNGIQSPGEPGVGLARVYADNGFYVDADENGKFHFVGLKPGLHLFKLDERSLLPGIEPGDSLRRTFHFTPGLDARLNFPVRCDLPESRPDQVRVLQEPPPPPVVPLVIAGSLSPVSLVLDGRPASVPMAEVALDLSDDDRRESANLGLLPTGALAEPFSLRVLPLPGPAARTWALIVTDVSGASVRVLTGEGAPQRIEWDGRDELGQSLLQTGALYTYRLRLNGPGGAFETAPRTFGIEWFDPLLGPPPPSPEPPPLVRVLDGALFGALDATPRKELIAAIVAMAPQLPKGDGRITIEAFADPSDRDADALTARRARAVADLLVAQGIASSRIVTFGLGGALPFAESGAANRRIKITAVLPPPPAPPPPSVPQPLSTPALIVAGEPIVVPAVGEFRHELPRPDEGELLVRLTGADGRVIESTWKPQSSVMSMAGAAPTVQLDTRRGAALVGSGELALPMLGADVRLANGPVVELGDAGLKEPLRLILALPGAVAEWQLLVRDAAGLVIRQFDGKGSPPPELAWDGLSLRPGHHTVQLTALDALGNRFTSARRTVLVWQQPPSVTQTLSEADSFVSATSAQLRPRVRRQLAALARQLADAEGRVVIEGHSDDLAGASLAMERAETVRAELENLGLAADRLTVVGRGADSPIAPNLSERARRQNRRVEVRTEVAPPVANEPAEFVELLVEGQPAMHVGDGVYRVDLTAPPSGPLRIELRGSTGRLVDYRVAPPISEAPSGATFAATSDDALLFSDFDVPLPLDEFALPEPEPAASKIVVAMPWDAAPDDVAARRLLVRLPRDGATLRSGKLLVQGSSDVANTVTINGEQVALDKAGRFSRVLEFAPGAASVRIEAVDPDGHRSHIERGYVVGTPGLFIMGVADANAGTWGGQLEGIDTLALKAGGPRRFFLGGRVAGTVSGEVPVANHLGGFFQNLRLTVNVDSHRRHDDSAFRDLLDPARFYPIYGDGSTLVQEAPARGPVFARVDADDSHAMYGEFRTQLGQSELFRYDRTLYGAEMLFKRDWTPDVRTQLQVMAAPGDDRVRHGHVELRATGGSVYYLQSGNVIEGTERVRIVVRDRDTGLELFRQDRARYSDYFIGYEDGRLLFKQPVSSTAEPQFLVNHNLSTALDGHPVFIVVDYEYRDLHGDQGGVAGFHTRESFFGGLLTVGGGLLQESRGAADPYRLWGVELGTRKSDRTYAQLEFARSNGTDATSFFSSDGGLSYSPLGARCENPGDPACRSAGNAWKFEAAAELAELLGRSGELAQGRMYFQNLDAGFFANGALVEQGTMKYGLQLRWPFTAKDAVVVRHDSVESVLDADLDTEGLQAKSVARRISTLQYRHTEERWGVVAEYANAITTDSAVSDTIVADTLALGGHYRVLPELNLQLAQEGILRGDSRLLRSWQDHLTTTFGAQYRLNETLTATLQESVRWSGENATVLGLSTRIGDNAQLYVNERFSSSAGHLLNTTLVGGSMEPVTGMRAYGEYQLDGVMSGSQNRAVLGLNHRWTLTEGLVLSAGYERSQVVGDTAAGLAQGGVTGAAPGATQGSVLGVPPFAAPGLNLQMAIGPGASSRDVGSVGLEYLASSTFKLSARLELRFDDADPKFARSPGSTTQLPTMNVADRLQLVFLSTADWKWTDDVAFLSRVVYADAFTQAPEGGLTSVFDAPTLDARYLEATAGLALRPTQYDWMSLLAKVSRVIDRRPLDLATGAADMQTADVLSLSPTFETPFRVGFAHKLALKHVLSQVTGVPDARSLVLLNVNRVDLHVLPQLDVSAEYRFLWTNVLAQTQSPDLPTQGDLKHGALFEVAYRPNPYLRLGAGYNFSSFSDNELSRLDEFAGGFFIRATGTY